MFANELGAAIGRAVIDHDDFVVRVPCHARPRTDGKYFASRSRPFQLGITTLAATRAAGLMPRQLRRFRSARIEIGGRQRQAANSSYERGVSRRAATGSAATGP